MRPALRPASWRGEALLTLPAPTVDPLSQTVAPTLQHRAASLHPPRGALRPRPDLSRRRALQQRDGPKQGAPFHRPKFVHADGVRGRLRSIWSPSTFSPCPAGLERRARVQRLATATPGLVHSTPPPHRVPPMGWAGGWPESPVWDSAVFTIDSFLRLRTLVPTSTRRNQPCLGMSRRVPRVLKCRRFGSRACTFTRSHSTSLRIDGGTPLCR